MMEGRVMLPCRIMKEAVGDAGKMEGLEKRLEVPWLKG